MQEKWQFLPNAGGEDEGISDAGIETFKGALYPGIARESAQNSLDAGLTKPGGEALPVIIVFRQMSIPRPQIPGIVALQAALDACLARSKQRGIKKHIAFFERATRAARQLNISALLVEDYQTTGLVGPAKAGTPFHALVKGSGVSHKSAGDAGGSFGIGKNAAFAISALRTVFYSTRYRTNDGTAVLAQGKSILVSHEDVDGNELRATGYWGQPGFRAVEGQELLPKWLKREQVGTTVASIGFIEEDDWEWRMAESLLRNFFAAVRSGAVKFCVARHGQSPIEIKTETIESLFADQRVLDAADHGGTRGDLAFSAALDRIAVSPATMTFEEDIKDVGKFRLRLLEEGGLPRKVGFLRNGMYITDNLRSFGQPLVRFDLSRDFAALVEPADIAAKKCLRELENPKHDEFSADRLDDPTRREQVRRGMKRLGIWIRERIKETTATVPEAEIQLDEMSEFFAAPSYADGMPDPGATEGNPERIKLTTTSAQPRRVGSGPDGASGSAGGRKQSKGKGGQTTGSRPGRGRGAEGGRGGRSISFRALRTHLPSPEDQRRRVLSLEPAESGLVRLEVMAVGVARDMPLDILTIDGRPCAKVPRIEIKANERRTVTLELSEAYIGPVRVVLSKTEADGDAD